MTDPTPPGATPADPLRADPSPAAPSSAAPASAVPTHAGPDSTPTPTTPAPTRPTPTSPTPPTPVPPRDAAPSLPGVLVGHHTDPRRPTGVTVVVLPEGSTAGVDVRGAAPGTRETDLLDPVNTVRTVDAIMLAGGSAYGLDAAAGVMRWLEEHDRGVAVGPARVPIVPAAVVFDLDVGDASVRPDAAAGWSACEAAVPIADAQEGSVGAGAGATVGKLLGPAGAMRGGVGIANLCAQGVTLTAVVVVNAVGDVVDPGTGTILAGARAAGLDPVDTVAMILGAPSPAGGRTTRAGRAGRTTRASRTTPAG